MVAALGATTAFAKTRFVIRESGLRGLHIFAAISALKFFQRSLSLKIMRFGAGDFFRAVTALQFIQLVTGIFFLRQRHFPIGFGGVALLFGDQIFLASAS